MRPRGILLIGLNGYTICSGVINESLNGKNIVAVPLNLDDYMEIGYLTRENVEPSLFAQYYIDALKKFTMQYCKPKVACHSKNL